MMIVIKSSQIQTEVPVTINVLQIIINGTAHFSTDCKNSTYTYTIVELQVITACHKLAVYKTTIIPLSIFLKSKRLRPGMETCLETPLKSKFV